MRLKNKFAVVIGGAIGIGAAITKRLGKEGCNLFVTYHSEAELEKVKKLKEEMREYQINFFYEKLDVLKKYEILSFFKKVKSTSTNLDIAINNAGVATEHDFIDLTEKEWDFVMDVNAKGMFFCCQEEAKIMIKQNYGKIINNASIAAKIGVIYTAHYSASKYAVLGLTFTMAKELAKHNITVNVVCPGIVITGMKKRNWSWKSKFTGVNLNEIIEKDRLKVPLQRFAKPEDVANMFFFLSLEDSDYITGQAFNIDGGMENH